MICFCCRLRNLSISRASWICCSWCKISNEVIIYCCINWISASFSASRNRLGINLSIATTPNSNAGSNNLTVLFVKQLKIVNGVMSLLQASTPHTPNRSRCGKPISSSPILSYIQYGYAHGFTSVRLRDTVFGSLSLPVKFWTRRFSLSREATEYVCEEEGKILLGEIKERLEQAWLIIHTARVRGFELSMWFPWWSRSRGLGDDFRFRICRI